MLIDRRLDLPLLGVELRAGCTTMHVANTTVCERVRRCRVQIYLCRYDVANQKSQTQCGYVQRRNSRAEPQAPSTPLLLFLLQLTARNHSVMPRWPPSRDDVVMMHPNHTGPSASSFHRVAVSDGSVAHVTQHRNPVPFRRGLSEDGGAT